MKMNKDTLKAVEAANILLKYCSRYKTCKNCIFYYSGCVIGSPFLKWKIFFIRKQRGRVKGANHDTK